MKTEEFVTRQGKTLTQLIYYSISRIQFIILVIEIDLHVCGGIGKNSWDKLPRCKSNHFWICLENNSSKKVSLAVDIWFFFSIGFQPFVSLLFHVVNYKSKNNILSLSPLSVSSNFLSEKKTFVNISTCASYLFCSSHFSSPSINKQKSLNKLPKIASTSTGHLLIR